jgi:hypothetical protein
MTITTPCGPRVAERAQSRLNPNRTRLSMNVGQLITVIGIIAFLGTCLFARTCPKQIQPALSEDASVNFAAHDGWTAREKAIYNSGLSDGEASAYVQGLSTGHAVALKWAVKHTRAQIAHRIAANPPQPEIRFR